MESLKFDLNNLTHTIDYSSKPVINVLKIDYQYPDKDWSIRFRSGFIKVRISALDNKDLIISSTHHNMSFHEHITAMHTAPILEINRKFKFTGHANFQRPEYWDKWKIEIVLEGVMFASKEKLIVSYIDSNYIQKRVDDWEYRVRNLIELVQGWSVEKENNRSYTHKHWSHAFYLLLLEGFLGTQFFHHRLIDPEFFQSQ